MSITTKKNKVFIIGIFRTGTTSVCHAISYFGYKPYSLGPNFDLGPQDIDSTKHDDWKEYYPLIVEHISTADVFCDYPWMYIYEFCYRYYNNSKFILTTRNPEKLAASEYKWWLLNGIRHKDIKPKEYFINRYTSHYNRVIKYFEDKKDRFLLFPIEETDTIKWEKLTNFLDTKMSNIKFPHLNST